MNNVLVAPSVLNVPHDKLLEQSVKLEEFGADWIHCDVMDGIMVPNTALELSDICNLHAAVSLPLDVHLMCQHPLSVIETFVSAGASVVTVHFESSDDIVEVSKIIRQFGAKVGIALNPETPVDALTPFADYFDLVLIMSVKPGLGGQSFIPDSIGKIRSARKLFPNKIIEVDGGINAETAKCVIDAGADVLVAGSFIVHSQNVKESLEKLKTL